MPASDKTASRPSARLGWILPADGAALAINLFFAACSFAQIGKTGLTILGIELDRESIMGAVFLLLILIQLIFIRLCQRSANPLVRFLRLFHPQAFMPLWFSESIILSQWFSRGVSHDAFFAALDQRIFGFQPSIVFHQVIGGRLVVELFFFGYFFYYALITAGPWLLSLRKRSALAERDLFILASSFGILFIWYVFFRVEGPKYFFPELKASWYSNFKGYFFTWLMKGLFSSVNLSGAAFPSSHVALSTMALIMNARHNRPFLWLIVPMTVLLFLSTVYLYAHYAVDVIAGLPVGIGLYFLFSFIYRKAFHRIKIDSDFLVIAQNSRKNENSQI
jgi:membrane-associated phospholipid phosphatase